MDFFTSELSQTGVTDTSTPKTEKQSLPPAFNEKAALALLQQISSARPQVTADLQRTLNSLHACLQDYLSDDAAASNATLEANGDQSYQRLSLSLIDRDKNLSELTAKLWSSAQSPVGSKDASLAFKQSFQALPKSFDEGTSCGKALASTVTESLAELADRGNVGAGLARDLSIRGIEIKTPLSKDNINGAKKILGATASFIKANAQEVLRKLPPSEISTISSLKDPVTPSVPSESEVIRNDDYGEMLKKQRREIAHQASLDTVESDRPVSDETAQRIHSLIARAAAAARRGNLFPQENNAENIANPLPQDGEEPSTTASEAVKTEDNEVSLSELAAKASRLQQQFREDRRKLAEAGKLPDPAAYPQEESSTTPSELSAKDIAPNQERPLPANTEQSKNATAVLVKAIKDAQILAQNPAQEDVADNNYLEGLTKDRARINAATEEVSSSLTTNLIPKEAHNKVTDKPQITSEEKNTLSTQNTPAAFIKPLPSAAAAVNRGGDMPIPDETQTELSGIAKDGGLFRKLAALFTRSTQENSTTPDISTTPASIAPEVSAGNAMMRANPLDHFMKALAQAAINPILPKELRDEASKLTKKLTDPISDLTSANSWLSFVQGPMSPDSPRATAMQQWAFLLLCLRFKQLGKSVNNLLKKSKDVKLDDTLEDVLLNHPDCKDEVEKLNQETLGQISRLQSRPQDSSPLLMRYLPLPPTYEGGHEGSLFISRGRNEKQKNVWHLSFNFDLKDLGGIEIKATACLPEVKLSFAAESLPGLQAIQSHVDKLKDTLSKLGLEPSMSAPRLGRIAMLPEKKAEQGQEKSAPATGISLQI